MRPKARTLLLFYKGIMLPQTLCPQHSDAHMLPLAGRDGGMRHKKGKTQERGRESGESKMLMSAERRASAGSTEDLHARVKTERVR